MAASPDRQSDGPEIPEAENKLWRIVQNAITRANGQEGVKASDFDPDSPDTPQLRAALEILTKAVGKKEVTIQIDGAYGKPELNTSIRELHKAIRLYCSKRGITTFGDQQILDILGGSIIPDEFDSLTVQTLARYEREDTHAVGEMPENYGLSLMEVCRAAEHQDMRAVIQVFARSFSRKWVHNPKEYDAKGRAYVRLPDAVYSLHVNHNSLLLLRDENLQLLSDELAVGPWGVNVEVKRDGETPDLIIVEKRV